MESFQRTVAGRGGAEGGRTLFARHIEANLKLIPLEIEDAQIRVAGFRTGDELDVDVMRILFDNRS